MDVVTYSEARANLKDVMDRVVEDKTEVIVTRQRAEAVVGEAEVRALSAASLMRWKDARAPE